MICHTFSKVFVQLCWIGAQLSSLFSPWDFSKFPSDLYKFSWTWIVHISLADAFLKYSLHTWTTAGVTGSERLRKPTIQYRIKSALFSQLPPTAQYLGPCPHSRLQRLGQEVRHYFNWCSSQFNFVFHLIHHALSIWWGGNAAVWVAQSSNGHETAWQRRGRSRHFVCLKSLLNPTTMQNWVGKRRGSEWLWCIGLLSNGSRAKELRNPRGDIECKLIELMLHLVHLTWLIKCPRNKGLEDDHAWR